MKTLLLSVLLTASLFLSGCETLQVAGSNDLIVQYSTMKVIEESEDITSQDVVDSVSKARDVLEMDTTVSLDLFKQRLAQQIGWSELAPSDRLLILAVVNQVETTYKKQYDLDVLSDDVVYEINQFLDLVEQAALMVGDY